MQHMYAVPTYQGLTDMGSGAQDSLIQSSQPPLHIFPSRMSGDVGRGRLLPKVTQRLSGGF